MFHPLPLLLLQQANFSNGCSPDSDLAKAVLNTHNEFRQLVANRTFGPGSRGMFKLRYDCAYKGYAMTLLDHKACKRADGDVAPMGLSDNYFDHYFTGEPPQVTDDDVADLMPIAVLDWQSSLTKGMLDDKAIYNDETFAAFANMAYYKSLKVGCAYVYCPDAKGRLAITCVYSAIPKLGEALYPTSTTAKTGCTSNSSCTKIVKPSSCEKDPNTGVGLCVTDADEIPTSAAPSTSTTAAASSATTSTPADQTTTSTAETTTKKAEQMTDRIRNFIKEKHNMFRSNLAMGLVRNGKEGNQNCPQATNIKEMRYDLDLEKEAQEFADICPIIGSHLILRPHSGENFELFSTPPATYYDAFDSAMKTWWNQIYINGVNNQMKYIQYLETKPNAPIKFTQMAWAATYKVGCGIKRCDGDTVVVCRYRPRGNIYFEHIYMPGQMCGSCMGKCNAGLCPAPTV